MDTAHMTAQHTHTLWTSLLPPAMVGTDKKPLTLPTLDGAVGALLAQLPAQASSPAQALLQAAGVLTVCERAGQRPSAPFSATPTLTPAHVIAPSQNVGNTRNINLITRLIITSSCVFWIPAKFQLLWVSLL